MVGLVDVFVMGRNPDPDYIAAVALGAAMFSAVYWLFGFLRMGTTGLTAQAFGRGLLAEVEAIFYRALTIALVLGILIIALQWPLKHLLFALFEPSAEVGGLAETYYDVRVWGAPGLLIYLVELGILFGLQRMDYTLYLSVGLNLLNTGLDVMFVLGFGLEVMGVALGTVISEWSAALVGLLLVRRAYRRGEDKDQLSLFDPVALKRFFNISSNLILRTFFVQLPFFAGTVLATHLGDLTLALHGVLMQLFFIMTYSLDGFAHTAESLTGYFYGAKDPHNLRRAALYSSGWGFGLAIVTGLTFLLLGPAFVGLLTVAQDIHIQSLDYMPWLALAPILCVWAFLLDGIFIGTTHIVAMRNAMFVSAGIWAIVLAVTFPTWEYHAVWLALNAFMLARALLLGRSYPTVERAARAA
jgi:MATE family multidrug resistance protein